MKRSFLVAQLGARMHYAVPSILQQAGMLERLFTDLTAAKGWPRILGLLPQSILPASARRLAARMPRDIPAHKITAFTSFGWEYARRQARRNSTSDSSSAYLWAGKRFCQLILKHGFGNAQGIYTFNSAGLELLQEARRQGMKAIMEQTIAPKS